MVIESMHESLRLPSGGVVPVRTVKSSPPRGALIGAEAKALDGVGYVTVGFVARGKIISFD